LLLMHRRVQRHHCGSCVRWPRGRRVLSHHLQAEHGITDDFATAPLWLSNVWSIRVCICGSSVHWSRGRRGGGKAWGMLLWFICWIAAPRHGRVYRRVLSYHLASRKRPAGGEVIHVAARKARAAEENIAAAFYRA
jgi:hypothetical protein